MRFEESVRLAQEAQAELERARSGSEGWSDDLRQRFDAARFRPLTDAGVRLMQALKKAQEQCAAAERLLLR
jgi:hypothetical protein